VIEIKGSVASAKVFTDTIEEIAIAQIKELCDMAYTEGSKIRIMPDVHAGAGCTIGTTMTISDKVVPNLVGVDIGCGMETIRIENKHIELEKLDKLIYAKIPSGMNIRETLHKYNDEIDLTALHCFKEIHEHRAIHSIGTLGGGNHFIEADKDEEGNIYIVIHSGSRYLGNEVAKLYQDLGYKRLNGNDKRALDNLIKEYKAAGREKEIQSAMKEMKKQVLTNIPHPLAYVSEDLFEDYIHDMQIVQLFATLNRRAIADEIIRGMKLDVAEQFTTVHNYIDTDHMILRKGAVSAELGEKLLIPINMRDGSLICIGKGNEDWNCSAPHGAGRLMSRTQAKSAFTVSEFKKQMKDIYTTSVNKETLDECPMAYKDKSEIIKNIEPTAEILKMIKPIYNFKASE
jgi:tRNA-splicing ligase RtcB (3'-phosphate/5'-hydroxy nucleic acid ligase)